MAAFRIGLAVSGGADSTALLVLLARLRAALDFDAVVLHVNHGLPEESPADDRHVRALAKRFAVPFFQLRAKTVRAKGESVEMAARRVRQTWFAQMARRLHLDAIATGHHADDVAETVLLRLARAAGPVGLAGIKRISVVDGVTYVRPLLDLHHRDLCAFLVREGIPWREDPSNADVSIPRNKVRHVVLPWLVENFDPRFVAHVCRSAALLRGEGERSSAVGEAAPEDESPKPEVRPVRFTLRVEACTGCGKRRETFGTWPAVCEMARAALAGRTLEVRTWRAGDRIAPFGMGGKTRKLQDVFVTAKAPRDLRAVLPLVADAATGEILWVPGYRIAAAVAVPSENAPSWRLTLSPATC